MIYKREIWFVGEETTADNQFLLTSKYITFHYKLLAPYKTESCSNEDQLRDSTSIDAKQWARFEFRRRTCAEKSNLEEWNSTFLGRGRDFYKRKNSLFRWDSRCYPNAQTLEWKYSSELDESPSVTEYRQVLPCRGERFDSGIQRGRRGEAAGFDRRDCYPARHVTWPLIRISYDLAQTHSTYLINSSSDGVFPSPALIFTLNPVASTRSGPVETRERNPRAIWLFLLIKMSLAHSQLGLEAGGPGLEPWDGPIAPRSKLDLTKSRSQLVLGIVCVDAVFAAWI